MLKHLIWCLIVCLNFVKTNYFCLPNLCCTWLYVSDTQQSFVAKNVTSHLGWEGPACAPASLDAHQHAASTDNTHIANDNWRPTKRQQLKSATPEWACTYHHHHKSNNWKISEEDTGEGEGKRYPDCCELLVRYPWTVTPAAASGPPGWRGRITVCHRYTLTFTV